MNRYFVECTKAVESTDNINPITGNKGNRWKETCITHANENDPADWPAKTTSFIFNDIIIENKTNTALSKVISFTIPELTEKNSDTDDFEYYVLQTTLNCLEFSQNTEFLGIEVIGERLNENGSPTIMFSDEVSGLQCSIHKGSLISIIPKSKRGYLEKRIVNLIIYYR